jgi:hypothetical protein
MYQQALAFGMTLSYGHLDLKDINADPDYFSKESLIWRRKDVVASVTSNIFLYYIFFYYFSCALTALAKMVGHKPVHDFFFCCWFGAHYKIRNSQGCNKHM